LKQETTGDVKLQTLKSIIPLLSGRCIDGLAKNDYLQLSSLAVHSPLTARHLPLRRRWYRTQYNEVVGRLRGAGEDDLQDLPNISKAVLLRALSTKSKDAGKV